MLHMGELHMEEFQSVMEGFADENWRQVSADPLHVSRL